MFSCRQPVSVTASSPSQPNFASHCQRICTDIFCKIWNILKTSIYSKCLVSLIYCRKVFLIWSAVKRGSKQKEQPVKDARDKEILHQPEESSRENIKIYKFIFHERITKTGIHFTWTQYWVLPWESSRLDYDDHEWKSQMCVVIAQHVFHDDEKGWTGWGVVYELTRCFYMTSK